MCLAALQASSELGKCGCTLCAWQPFRHHQSLASVTAHYVPGSPSGVTRAWQVWLHIMCLAALQASSELGKCGCTLCAWQSFRHHQSLASVAAHYVPAGSPSGIIRAWQVWLHIMCLAALQASSELGKCGCTLCAWQSFRHHQSLASVAAHSVPGSPSGIIRAWQVWLHIMCLAALQASSELGKCGCTALQTLSELGKRGCTLCAWQPLRRYQSLASVASHYVPGSPSGIKS